MSLIRSLNSGVSGLRSFQTKMDVIGNNIANVETAGYKSSRVSFSEMMNQNIGRSGGGDSSPQMNNQVGLGVRVSSIDRDFSQGALQTTGRNTDLAIEGSGYFMVNEGGENLLTRAGNFVFNKDGYLVDQGGRFVQGYNADASGNILPGGIPDSIRVDFENALQPNQTDIVTLAGNLNANTSTLQVSQAQNALTIAGGAIAELTTDLNDLSQVDTALVNGDEITFDVVLNDGTVDTIDYTYTAGDTVQEMIDAFNTGLNNPDPQGTLEFLDGVMTLRSSQLGDSDLQLTGASVTTGAGAINFPAFMQTQEGSTQARTMSTTIYDDLGRAHSLILEFSQSGENEWDYTARFLDGQEITQGAEGSVEFDETGQLDSDNLLNLAFDPGNGANPMGFDIQLGDESQGTRFTQFAGSNTAKVIGQDGYAQGSLVDINIDGDGRVEGIYDNGQNMVLGQMSIAQAQNENGLEMIGSGLFRATSAAGEIFVDTADNLAESNINSGTLEGSNVDLAKEFTEMITSQRAYQSNARVISTSDEMLMEAVNLKR